MNEYAEKGRLCCSGVFSVGAFRPCLIVVGKNDQLIASITHVPNVEQKLPGQLVLHREVPVLHIRCPRIPGCEIDPGCERVEGLGGNETLGISLLRLSETAEEVVPRTDRNRCRSAERSAE